MTTQRDESGLAPALRRLLDAVRARVRAYVWLEGLAIVVVLLGAAFWLGLALDWTFEPSSNIRRVVLIAIGVVALWAYYRYVLRRAFAPISDSSLALLLERRFPKLSDHVLTAVHIGSNPERSKTYNADLIATTQHAAVRAIADVRPSQIFNRGPLLRASAAAISVIASVVLFALLSRDTFGFWLERIALSDERWPRRVSLQVVGFERDADGKRVHKLAQDDDFELMVHARTTSDEFPDEVEIRFRLADGRRGRDTMIRVGDASPGRDEFQLYRYDFKRVAGDMTFDVVGGDDRVRDLELRVVERPELFAIELECIYPNYLGRERRRLPVTGGMRIPEGTQLVLHASASKPLVAAQIKASQDQKEQDVKYTDQPQSTLRWEYGTLEHDDVLLVNVTDIDGVSSREPYRISMAVVSDEVPQVIVRLSGIGTAITPDVILPLKGKLTDDYGLARAWFQYQVDSGTSATRALSAQPSGQPVLEEIDAFDTRALDESTGKRALTLRPGQKLSLTLRATDYFDLNDRPRAGSSQLFTLDVVTMAELLELLDRRELQLRQRYESIYEKMVDTRNLLARVDTQETPTETADPPAAEPPSANATNTSDTAAEPSPATAGRAVALRRLRVSGSLQHVVQSADEVIGVAEAFDDLHDQLTNNRIENPDLQSRLREQIAQPLHRIGSQRMPQLAAQLKLVEEHLQDDSMRPELAKCISTADQILVEMKEVLDRMLELETYNEVVALLRGIISDQDEINRRTKDRQKDRLRSLFEEE
ncbi:MAG TPA: hypothetical protein VGK58_10955 [Lacipirellulaceae bacterium]